MAFEQPTRVRLQKFVAEARELLREEFTRQLQNDYGLNPATGAVTPLADLPHLDDERRETARVLREMLEHYRATSAGGDDKTLLDRIVREQAFTVLNRLAALRMAEARGFLVESLGAGFNSKGFQIYKILAKTGLGETGAAYRCYLFSLFDEFAVDLAVLFDRFSPFGRLFPGEAALLALLDKINHHEIAELWAEDETIGWIYQYFNSKEERKKMRDESAAPRNSRELAVRNQFFTPRYVVEFLTDNTLGRTWFEMTNGDTKLTESCRYLVKPIADEIQNPKSKIQNRKDPREILMLDPACGSMHFGLYAFDLFLTIYEEAWDSNQSVKSKLKPLREIYGDDKAAFLRDVPRLIIENNIHGVDIDARAAQIAGLSLWLRAQRAWAEMGVKPVDRPVIRKSNIVTAEPMPGEADLLEEFIVKHFADAPEKRVLGEFVRRIFALMRLAGEAGSLLKIEEDVKAVVNESRAVWEKLQAAKEELYLFEGARTFEQQPLDFDIGEITSENFFETAEREIYKALRRYAENTDDGAGYARRLFADDAARGFAFIDVCRRKYDAVLMNPPFGDASLPSKNYIDETYGDTKGDVYKAFVECFQDRLVAGGMLGIISSRTGFFLSGSADWRERVVLRLFRPLLLADFGMGVLDAMVETAGYVLRNLTEAENRELTLSLLPELAAIPTDKRDYFSAKKYQDARGLKRHQANAELERLHTAGFVKPDTTGAFPKWSPQRGTMKTVQVSPLPSYPQLTCFRLPDETDKGAALAEMLANENDSRRFVANPNDFRQVPNTPFCYWVSNDIRRLFKELPAFESEGRIIQHGLSTKDDFRFLRLFWEVPISKICPPSAHVLDTDGAYCVLQDFRWFSLAKGGAYSTFYSDLHLVADWRKDGSTIEKYVLNKYPYLSNADWILHHEANYFHAGLTWSRRSQKGFSVRPHTAGNLFSDKSPVAFINKKDLVSLLGVMNSNVFQKLLSLQMVFGSFEIGVVQRTPVPNFQIAETKLLNEKTSTIIETKRNLDTANETSHVFQLPALLQMMTNAATQLPSVAAQLPRAETQVLRANAQVLRANAQLPRAETQVPNEETQLPIAETQLVIGETQLVIDKTQVSDDKTQLVIEETQLVIEETQLVIGETQPIIAKTQVVGGETQFDDGDLYDGNGDLQNINGVFTLTGAVNAWTRRVALAEHQLREYQQEIDDIAFRLYGISDADRQAIESGVESRASSVEDQSDDEDEPVVNEPPTPDGRLLTQDLLSYLCGAAFGRWDVRFATRETQFPALPDPFAPLPVNAPGALTQLRITNYELRIAESGILVDDMGNSADIEASIRDVLSLVFKDRMLDIENEICEILRVGGLREYFRKPALFFAEHLKRYSKSRRQAPLYLPLSTRSGEYTIWLYYHRLTGQTLYTVVNDFVEPKLKSVREELDGLRRAETLAAPQAKRRDDLQEFAFELEELQAELLRLAPVWKPNLNDGVQITMSPLWKLFRLAKWQKLLKETWTKLEKGDYDWAHLAFSMFPERVREKCQTDKSLAIAHNLEDLYLEPPAKPKRKARTD